VLPEVEPSTKIKCSTHPPGHEKEKIQKKKSKKRMPERLENDQKLVEEV
jgi:hypothetical protein